MKSKTAIAGFDANSFTSFESVLTAFEDGIVDSAQANLLCLSFVYDELLKLRRTVGDVESGLTNLGYEVIAVKSSLGLVISEIEGLDSCSESSGKDSKSHEPI